ncbi:MAG: DNA-binding protein [bacterium]|nr:DNA-binding protein [bacterium]
MKFIKDEFNYTLRLEKGELLVESLTKFVTENKIKGGWVMGLGGLKWAELGFYDLPSQSYTWAKLDEPLELTNLTGNLAWQDEAPLLHLHATVSGSSLHARGGHLKESEVAGTVELFLHFWDGDKGLKRTHDSSTGLALLEL